MAPLNYIEACAAVAVKCKLPFGDYKLLLEWLAPDCYHYVPPAERLLSTELIFHIAADIKTPSDLFRIWLASDILYSTLTLQEQERLLSWMKDYNYLATVRS